MPTTATYEQTSTFEQRYFQTLRRARAVGAVALKGSHAQELVSYERRRYDELTSGLAEALSGRVSTHYSFEPNQNGKLVAEDGEPIEWILNRGLVNARLLAAEDSFYDFCVERTHHELAELAQQEAIANGRVNYNTLITFSPYNQELAGSDEGRQKLRYAAQKPEWQRAMLRVSHWDGQQMHIFTRSIDGSNTQLLKATAWAELNYQYKASTANQMLGERITRNITGDYWQGLADRLVERADSILSGGLRPMYKQGRPLAEAADLQQFVLAQSDVVESLVNSGRQLALECPDFSAYQEAFNEKVYDCISLLKWRTDYGAESVINVETDAAVAGAIAREQGQVYDMCGLVLGEKRATTASQTGFESLMRLLGKKITCPECKSKVKVPSEDLAAGKLVCPDCGYGVEVCTNRNFKRKIAKPADEAKDPGFVELLAKALTEHAQAKTPSAKG